MHDKHKRAVAEKVAPIHPHCKLKTVFHVSVLIFQSSYIFQMSLFQMNGPAG